MRKLPGKINGDLITQEFFPEYVGNEEEINCGDCYRWAYIAYKLYDGVELWSNENHAFPYQRGQFFDSESPDGEDCLEDLHCNCCSGKTEEDSWRHKGVRDFVQYWDENGRYNFEDVDDLDRKIRNFWRRFDRKNTPRTIKRTKNFPNK